MCAHCSYFANIVSLYYTCRSFGNCKQRNTIIDDRIAVIVLQNSCIRLILAAFPGFIIHCAHLIATDAFSHAQHTRAFVQRIYVS
jgi:hypothetical protein